jgi:thioredoxin reductase (NADPH)
MSSEHRPVETPDVRGAFPRLSDAQVELLARYGERRRTQANEILFHEGDPAYDFFVVLEGLVAAVEDLGVEERVIGVHGPRRFLGELNLLTGQPAFYTAVVVEPGEVLVVPAERLRQLVVEDTALGDLILRSFLVRRSLLIELGAGVRIVGSRFSRDARRLRDFLARNRIPHTWVDVEQDVEAERLLRALDIAPDQTPVVICGATQVLRNPTTAQLAEALGLHSVNRQQDVADLLVIGGGPAGLAASVYGSSEGLATIMLEAVAVGGQAGTASRIENYLGFPAGISGFELAERAELQARKFGTRIVVPSEATALEQGDGYDVVTVADGSRLAAHTIVLATGARYRRLDVPRLEDFEGIAVFYAATEVEALQCRTLPVVVVGGGNSAGQATVFLAQRTPRVRLVVRGADLGESMSRYLADRIESTENVEVLLNTEVRELVGETQLEGVVVENATTGERQTLEAGALFMFIGADPCTEWLRGSLTLDDHGFVPTGRDLEHLDGSGWRDERRAPLPLETSRPGIFAAGDVRSGSVKRVAAAVGEGAMAVQLVHQFLALRA